MLLYIGIILVVLWLLGLLTHIGGSLIYALLVIGLIVAIYDLLVGRRHSEQ